MDNCNRKSIYVVGIFADQESAAVVVVEKKIHESGIGNIIVDPIARDSAGCGNEIIMKSKRERA